MAAQIDKWNESSRKPVELSEGLRKWLTTYAAAAGASCVGTLALAQPAQAGIIVNNNPISIGLNSTVPFQINGVTVVDFVDVLRGKGYYFADLYITLGLGDVVASRFGFVSRLAKGVVIGPAASFAKSFATVEFYYNNATYGQWDNKSGYIGFEFLSNGLTHFGWAHAQVSLSPAITATIDQYAYDTVGNQSIQAGQTSASTPEPGTLDLLALGSLGLCYWRRKVVGSTSNPR